MQEVPHFIPNYDKISLDWANKVSRRKSRHFCVCLVWVYFIKKNSTFKSVFDDKKFLWNAFYENLPEKIQIEDLFLLEPEVVK